MRAIEQFNRFNATINYGIEWIGIAAFVLMMLLTTVDVVGAKLFLAPVPGALDLMMLAQLTAISFALGASYIADRHVEVEFFVPLLPGILQRLVTVMVRFFVLALFILVAWQMFVYGSDLKNYTEVSPTIRIPLYPFAYATAIAFIPAILASLGKFAQSLIEAFKR